MKETLDPETVVDFTKADICAVLAACTTQLCDLLRASDTEEAFDRLYVATSKVTQLFGFRPDALDGAIKRHLATTDPPVRCTVPPDAPSDPADLSEGFGNYLRRNWERAAADPKTDPASAFNLANGVYIISTSEECNCNGGPTHRKVTLRGGSNGEFLLTRCCEWALWLMDRPVNGPYSPDIGTWRWFRAQGVNLTEPPEEWLDTLRDMDD